MSRILSSFSSSVVFGIIRTVNNLQKKEPTHIRLRIERLFFFLIDFKTNKFAGERYFINSFVHGEWQSNGLKGYDLTIVAKTIKIRREKEGKKREWLRIGRLKRIV